MDFIIAILMPTYNHEHFIAQAIEGVISQQSNFKYKLFIIDDCSVDSTYKICKYYSDTYTDKIIFSKNEKNLGPNKTGELLRELGFNSVAKYIAICEGDDYWTDPFKLQKQVDFLEANPDYVVTYNDARIIDAKGVELHNGKLAEEFKRDASASDLKKSFWLLALTMCFRNVLIECPNELKGLNADTIITNQLGKYGKGKFLETVTSDVYRFHPTSTWSSRTEYDRKVFIIYTYVKLYKYYFKKKENEIAEFYDNIIDEKCQELIGMVIRRESIHHYIKAYIIFLKDNKAYLKLYKFIFLQKSVLRYTINLFKGKFRHNLTL